MNHSEQTKDFFDRLAPVWDQSCRHDPDKLAAIVMLCGIQKGDRVADIGCGTGVLFPFLLAREPAELLGIDLSDRMIAAAGDKFKDSRLRLLAADLFTAEEHGFQAATIYSAYPHFPDKEKLAKKISDMLAAGGRILIAHSQGRETINTHHHSCGAGPISVDLLPAVEEAERISQFFLVDTLIDTPEMYIISGIKRTSGKE